MKNLIGKFRKLLWLSQKRSKSDKMRHERKLLLYRFFRSETDFERGISRLIYKIKRLNVVKVGEERERIKYSYIFVQ